MSKMFPQSVLLFLVLLLCLMCSGWSASLSVSVEPKIGCIEEERRALLNIKHDLHATGNTTDDPLSSWGNEDDKRDCCKWFGIRCDNESGHVVSLDLSELYFSNGRLEGKINPSLFELQYLTHLDLNGIDFTGSRIPKSIGTLTQLRYLYLSSTYVSGEVPPQLANLSRLEVLNLGYNLYLTIKNLEWLSHLSSLRILSLSGTNLSRVTDWAQRVNQLPSLTTLELHSCSLPDITNPLSLSIVNSSISLIDVDISSNYLSGPIFPWLFNSSNSLKTLMLSFNRLQGSIPKAFNKMTSLTHVDFMDNQLNGSIPDIFWNVSGIDHLYLEYNMLEGEFPRSIWNLSSLSALRVRSNNLHGHLPEGMSQLQLLRTFDVSRNFLQGEISQAHFSNLSQLALLDLSSNLLSLNFHTNWTPPFQLDSILLGSCMLGPQFPKWLQTQTNFTFLNISNSRISDSIPDWFWYVSTTFEIVDLSNNQISGGVGNYNISLQIATYIDLSSNQLEGPIPSFLFQADHLNLFQNRFSKLDAFCNNTREIRSAFLDISNNSLSKELPDCWSQFKSLNILILTNNKLSGRVPSSFGSLNNIMSLNLNNNKFMGDLPSTLKNCANLEVIDFGENDLSGTIPTWLGNSLSNLSILSLRSNGFSGGIPNSLCHLSNIRVLDLSFNHITGSIPKCISSFTAMRIDNLNRDTRTTITVGYEGFEMQFDGFAPKDYEENLVLEWKGGMAEFRRTLALVKSIDLSSNKLNGEIPREITELSGLVSFNLSRNNLSGQIPAEIGRMKSLDALDLSRNHFSGHIPQSLAQIDRLNTLDLSFNNLSGKIPTGTQLQSFPAAYLGNPELCGEPLPKNCSDMGQATPEATDEESDELFNRGFYISMAIGFTIAFWGVCGALIFKKSFRYAYFKLLNDIGDRVYVTTAIQKAKLLRMIKG